MEVMAPPTINALNGSSVKLSCTFNSCYKVENKQFSLNWTYQECSNCSEELVSLAGDLLKGFLTGQPVQGGGAWLGNEPVGCQWGDTASPAVPVAAQFLQFRTKIMNKQLDRFGNRVEFTGNPAKYDVSFTLKNVQLEDEGTYNCYVLNPPDRHRGHGKISLRVLTKGQCSQVLQGVLAEPCPFPAVPTACPEPVPCVPRAPKARLDGGRDRGRLRGRVPGRGDPGADGGEMRAPEKAAEAQHGRPEDRGGREDGRRRQPG